MTESCNVTGQSVLCMGGVTASILFFFYCGKLVPCVFKGPAGKRKGFFSKKLLWSLGGFFL